MDRYLQQPIKADLDRKIVLLSGPRQVGKTTLSRMLFEDHDYLNWDLLEHRAVIQNKQWDRKQSLVVFDELHKKNKFKSFLKGVYDVEGIDTKILVTGSARLDIAKKMGDSLAGRFFQYRLFPLDLWELKDQMPPEQAYDSLIKLSGFPEPFLAQEQSFYARWSVSHLDVILRQDLLDLTSVRSVSQIETLISILQHRVGATVSTRSLARDLEVDAKTVKRWLEILENLFIVFKVTPYHKNVARSLLKEPKYYFYDIARVRGDEGAKYENLVALSLFKQLCYLADAKGIFAKLFFLKTKDGQEIDFYIDFNEHKNWMIECKLSDDSLSPHFKSFRKHIDDSHRMQLVKNIDREKTYETGEEVRAALPWLVEMPLV